MPTLKLAIAFGETMSSRGLSYWICATHSVFGQKLENLYYPKVAFSVNITASFWLDNCDYSQTLFSHPDFAHFILPITGSSDDLHFVV